ncbi:MAG: HAMP domain-containing protein [Rubrivivax sp.]|nr:HAMP domain-containing protein [Rubrivivax sp.]
MTLVERHRRWHAARRWKHSVQWRLVTLFIVFALATTAVFLMGTQRALRAAWQGWAQPIVSDQIDRLAAEIGSPPDVRRAEAIAARLPVAIRIEGPAVRYESGIAAGGWARPPEDGARRPGARAAAGLLVRTTDDGHRITFGLAEMREEQRPRWFGGVTLAALLGLTALAFLAVRRLLRPLQAIGAGVARYGAGDFTQPIAVKRRDEFGELAERIDRMAASLHGMLDAKRALLLAISHELRSPLTRARVNAELVPEGDARDALLHDLAEMRDLITDLLESERLSAGHAALHAEAVDLPSLLREAVAVDGEGGAAAAEGQGAVDVPVRLELEPGIGSVQADPARLRLLLRNLLDNARRHGGGTAAPPTVFLRRADSGAIELGVRDEGPGVDAEHLSRLAEPFFRTDAARTRASGGVGLGLYLCRLVAQAHGGELVIERAEPGLRVAMRWRAA